METAEMQDLQAFLDRRAVPPTPSEKDPLFSGDPVYGAGTAPLSIVRPGDVEELRQLVAWSNQEGLNLAVTSSSGRHRKGGIAAGSEHLLIDLAPWDGIGWADRRNRVCMVQPGVTWGSLLHALEKEGMTASMPLAPRSGKSVVASVMDREPSTWPNRQWDISDPAASTECIFGDGSVFRTGAAGGPGSLEQQRAAGGAQKYSGGPSQTDLHRLIQGSQGTLGLVTWITLRTEQKPAVQEPWLLGADTLDPLIACTYEVQRSWLGEHAFLLNRAACRMLLNADPDAGASGGGGALPRYVCLQNLAGFQRLPRERVKYQKRDIREIAGRHGLSPSPLLGGVSAGDLLAAATRPCGETDWRDRARGRCLSIFFLTTLDRVPGLLEVYFRIAGETGTDAEETGVYLQPVVQNHACHVEIMVPFDGEAPGGLDRACSLEREAVQALARAGAFFSRPYGSAPDIVFGRNPVHLDLIKKMKGIFDPNRVLNRGKWDL